MALIESFYAADADYSNYINIRYMLEIEIEKFIAEKLFMGDVNRIIIASNEMAFRKRGTTTDGDYQFPFLNYWLKTYEYNNDFGWYNMVLEKRGLYIPELDKNVRVMPIVMEFEASYWCNRTDEMQYALQQLIYVKENHTAFQVGFKVGETELKFIGIFNIHDLEPNAEYTDADWLEKNKISNIGMTFSILAMEPKIAGSIGLIEEIVFDFAAKIRDTTGLTPDEKFSIVKNKLSGQIEVTQDH